MSKISAILLAGGVGSRMGEQVPKQYLPLHGKSIALYSVELFMAIEEIGEIIVVCEQRYQKMFPPTLRFAKPGIRRQDSLYHALELIAEESEMVVIHDAARPLVTRDILRRAIEGCREQGAAAVGVLAKSTIKESCEGGFVKKTLDRSLLWEIQTPQVIRSALLKRAVDHAKKHSLEVTDDVSLVEAVNHPVKIIEGSYQNIKITTAEDLKLAEILMR